MTRQTITKNEKDMLVLILRRAIIIHNLFNLCIIYNTIDETSKFILCVLISSVLGIRNCFVECIIFHLCAWILVADMTK